jgi:hypothetical protein
MHFFLKINLANVLVLAATLPIFVGIFFILANVLLGSGLALSSQSKGSL